MQESLQRRSLQHQTRKLLEKLEAYSERDENSQFVEKAEKTCKVGYKDYEIRRFLQRFYAYVWL